MNGLLEYPKIPPNNPLHQWQILWVVRVHRELPKEYLTWDEVAHDEALLAGGSDEDLLEEGLGLEHAAADQGHFAVLEVEVV